jgi:hypothetical protein
LKGLKFRACRYDIELEAIRYLFGAKFKMSVRASMMANHSTVKEKEEVGKLFVRETCK